MAHYSTKNYASEKKIYDLIRSIPVFYNLKKSENA